MKTLQFTEKTAYQGESIYVGIDVHKKNWGICILGDYLERKVYSQPPQPEVLVNYLHTHFPGASYYSAYEAGFNGFWIDRELQRYGINNVVVNPSDIPTTDKNDKRDARKIAKGLRHGNLRRIYVPHQYILEDRLLLRGRQKLLADIKRCKCRIKSQLHFFGIKIPEALDKPYWSRSFRHWLQTKLFEGSAQVLLTAQLEELESIERQKKNIEKQIIALAKGKYNQFVSLLRSIPGIGILAAMTLITELVNMEVLRRQIRCIAFWGLVPNVYVSGETEIVRGMTERHNAFLKPILIQAAWRAAKLDPSLMLTYNQLCRRMKPNKAIIRIAKKLSNRIRYVWKNQISYQNL
ncbi:IS110 family transposase [Sinomicrobium pectinilyticum]|uniref:IS110 family transposase n=1 Tax=Sinomicrobium pectinilyticum TaxID=1084421 RepID=A0A3N0DHY1_SINP1|nr:IS110 family transposase [Sinomicrobium pectinilyticum]RNL75288.1 IS110 family transposase [Sinomicrobium pectinilyticum]